MFSRLKALTIYPKLVLSFLLIILPIYITSLMMNQSGQDYVKDQIAESLSSRIHFYLSSLDTEFARLIRLKAEYMTDDDLMDLAAASQLLNDYERTELILAVKSKLYLLKSSSPFVNNVKLFVPALGRSITANDYEDTIAQAELDAILNPDNMRTPIFSMNDALLMSGVYPDAVYLNRQPILAIGIELSRKEMVRTLSNIVTREQGGAALINRDRSWSLSSGIDEASLTEFTQQLQQQTGLDDGAHQATAGQMTLTMSGKNYFIAYAYSPLLDATLAVFVPVEQVLQPLSEHRDWLWLLSFIAVVLVALFAYWIYRLIHRPLRRLVVSFRKVEKGDLRVRVQPDTQDEFHYLYTQFNTMLSRIERLIGEVYEQQIRSQQSELKQLQSQINPHFFYNCFFILQGLVRMGQTELADRMLHHLGSYFHFITRSGKEFVPLDMEISHAVSYVEIQKLRFGDAIDVEMDSLPASWRMVEVPRLIVQPLIENAYKHALEHKVTGGRLRIGFAEQDEGRVLTIEVEDNGAELGDERLAQLARELERSEQAMEMTGILNTHRRLQLRFGREYGLTVARGAWGGMNVQIRLTSEGGERHVEAVDRR
ncbi:sensor histidine kinase [Paenibacillus sp. 598K]|uniref:sensor histidine kinase n=1 Tax=Paenibacillus sp. 598K TaxID=1117987 RepID=UPI000FFAB0B9|nr:histidine kinase [Paenibacillus sp. 598K]GBF74695.1 sensor histidine kinase [Paenibacillus sp. 598K]